MHPPAPVPARGRAHGPFAAVAAALGLAAALAGCAPSAGLRDEGTAAELSPPVSARPLWPESAVPGSGDRGPTRTAASPTAAPGGRAAPSYPPVQDVTVPAGGLRRLGARVLLAHDPNITPRVRAEAAACPGTRCPLRPPAYRDLTGDGREEMVVAVDEADYPGQSLVEVYRAYGNRVRPVLVYWGGTRITGETVGRDLLLHQTGSKATYTIRFRWDGTRLAPAPVRGDPGDGAAPPATTPTAPPARTHR